MSFPSSRKSCLNLNVFNSMQVCMHVCVYTNAYRRTDAHIYQAIHTYTYVNCGEKVNKIRLHKIDLLQIGI